MTRGNGKLYESGFGEIFLRTRTTTKGEGRMTEVQSDKLVIELQKRIDDSDLAARLGKTSNTIDNWQKNQAH